MRIYTILTQQYNIKKRNLPTLKKKNHNMSKKKLLMAMMHQYGEDAHSTG